MSANSINGSRMPIILIDTEDRERRPRESSYATWIVEVEPSLQAANLIFKDKYGLEMTMEDTYKFLAWSMEGALARVLWTLDNDPQALTIVASAAFDHYERYLGYRLGAFPPPNGDRYESPLAFERFLTEASKKDMRSSYEGHGTYL